jgi:CBS domain-containing protein
VKDKLTAGDICTRSVALGYPSLALNEAARLMRARHVGCLVVVEEVAIGENLVVGILTDRDIAMSVVAADRDPHGLRVGDVMTRDVVSAREHDSLLDLLAAMRRRKVRRVPVTNPRDMLVGIVSLDDVLAVMAEQMQAVAAAVTAATSHERTTSS